MSFSLVEGELTPGRKGGMGGGGRGGGRKGGEREREYATPQSSQGSSIGFLSFMSLFPFCSSWCLSPDARGLPVTRVDLRVLLCPPWKHPSPPKTK